MDRQGKVADTAATQQAKQDLIGGVAKVGGADAQAAIGMPPIPELPKQ